jgi:hypothetical protein
LLVEVSAHGHPHLSAILELQGANPCLPTLKVNTRSGGESREHGLIVQDKITLHGTGRISPARFSYIENRIMGSGVISKVQVPIGEAFRAELNAGANCRLNNGREPDTPRTSRVAPDYVLSAGIESCLPNFLTHRRL